jgi:hypothetical protein
MKAAIRALRWVALRVAPIAGVWLLKAMGRTTRVRLENFSAYDARRQAREPTLFAFWHDQLLAMTVSMIGRGQRYTVLISQHPDGDLIARTVAGLEVDPVRGSSSRGGLKAMTELVRRLRAGGNVVFTPDGPRGPRHRASSGTIVLAQRARVPIMPVACAVRPRIRAGSWDRLQVPMPFARGAVVGGDVIRVPSSAGPAMREQLRCELENSLTALTLKAERMVGR